MSDGQQRPQKSDTGAVSDRLEDTCEHGSVYTQQSKGQLVTWLKGEVKKKHPISRAPTSKSKNQKDKVDKPKKTKKDKAEAPKKTRKEHQQSLPKMLQDSYRPKPLKVDQMVAVADKTGLFVGKVRSIDDDGDCAHISVMSYSGDGVFSPPARLQVEEVDARCVIEINFPVENMKGGKIKVQKWEALNAHYLKYKKEYKL
ncbi:Hypp3494 [Branchiostoma lanceolatum]|uniref:Hypp3494 protein n=1 Tax=Branchiostoma lanceolatum TaxID=7740 RepID=A0A8K0EXC2_BRALA|nr:Hypp3494 [Branchiostoma lanceolatum]